MGGLFRKEEGSKYKRRKEEEITVTMSEKAVANHINYLFKNPTIHVVL